MLRFNTKIRDSLGSIFFVHGGNPRRAVILSAFVLSDQSMKEEKTYQIVDACVPRGTSVKLARYLSRSPELVNRWRRPPEADEEPYGTGLSNPLDTVEAIQDHAFAHAPAEAHRIHLYFERRYENAADDRRA